LPYSIGLVLLGNTFGNWLLLGLVLGIGYSLTVGWIVTGPAPRPKSLWNKPGGEIA
jgi:hypothetical protein